MRASVPCPHHITFAFWVAKHSLVTFLKEPREVRLVSFSFRAEIHPHLYYILFLLFCQYKRANFYKNNGKNFLTSLPLFIILFGIKTVSKTCASCRKSLIYKTFSTLVYYSHSLTSSFPQLLFALFGANFREISLVLLRFSLYSLCSQPVWYCFGIKVWYQFSEKSAEKKSVILFE